MAKGKKKGTGGGKNQKQWLISAGGEFSDKLSFRSEDRVTYLSATNPIPSGETLLSIPLDNLISFSNSNLSKLFLKYIDVQHEEEEKEEEENEEEEEEEIANCKNLSPALLLTAVILYEHFKPQFFSDDRLFFLLFNLFLTN